jgi:hypothetical protein
MSGDDMVAPGSTGDPATRETRQTETGLEHPCPRCQSQDVASILYGLPEFSDELDRRTAAGETWIGGCIIGYESPRFHCNACGYPFGDLEWPSRVPR